MSRDERRQQMDPNAVERIRARWARIKVAIAAKHMQEMTERWPAPNSIEAVLLRRRLKGGDGHEPRPNGA